MGMEVGRQAGPTGQSSEGHFRGRRPSQGGSPKRNGPPRRVKRLPSLEAAEPPSQSGGQIPALSLSGRAPGGFICVVSAGRGGTLGETPGRPREARAGGRTCAPRPPRLARAPAIPTAWSRSSPQVSRPWPQAGPGPVPLRSGCRARRCSRPDPVRRRTRLAPLPLPLSAEAAGRWRRPWHPGPCRSPSGGWRLHAAAAS